MKHRISDFIVNEIDENGKVVWFKSEIGNESKWISQDTVDKEKSGPELVIEVPE